MYIESLITILCSLEYKLIIESRTSDIQVFSVIYNNQCRPGKKFAIGLLPKPILAAICYKNWSMIPTGLQFSTKWQW